MSPPPLVGGGDTRAKQEGVPPSVLNVLYSPFAASWRFFVAVCAARDFHKHKTGKNPRQTYVASRGEIQNLRWQIIRRCSL